MTEQQSWHGVQIVRSTDSDDVQVKLHGKETKAFLVGSRRLRETVKENENPRAFANADHDKAAK